MNGGLLYQFMIGIYAHDGCEFRLVLTAVMHESAQTELIEVPSIRDSLTLHWFPVLTHGQYSLFS